jgi:hypothetical protein
MNSSIKLCIQEGLFPVKEYSFSEPGQYLIGRAEDCDVQLEALGLVLHRNVSRHHCLLEEIRQRPRSAIWAAATARS